jgi:hypothetical protein
MPFVFKLSRTGKDISSTNPQDFVFNSELGSVKIVKQPPNKTALNVTVGASTTATVTIAHNLGFIPLVMVYAEKSPSTGKFYNGYAIHGGSEVGDVTLLPIGGGTYVLLYFRRFSHMKKYVFKMSKKDKDVNNASANDLLIDSDQPFFKFHQDSTNTVTLTPGDTHASVDFNHGLDYTPAFIAYYLDQNDALHFIPALPYPFGFETPGIASAYPYAYVDGTKVRCGVQIALGAYNYTSNTAPSDWYSEYGGGVTTFLLLGNRFGGAQHGALRFTGVSIPQGETITEAILKIAVEFKGGSSNLEAKIYGLDEDNTAAFGNPSGRPRTTAFDDASWSLPAAGGYSEHDVTAIVQEIVNRAGWAGDALGFYLLDDGSPTDVYIEDDYNTGIQSQLTIKYGSNQTLTFRTIIFKDKIA